MKSLLINLRKMVRELEGGMGGRGGQEGRVGGRLLTGHGSEQEVGILTLVSSSLGHPPGHAPSRKPISDKTGRGRSLWQCN